VGILTAFWSHWVSQGIYVLVDVLVDSGSTHRASAARQRRVKSYGAFDTTGQGIFNLQKNTKYTIH
jgi:hypothetical protein